MRSILVLSEKYWPYGGAELATHLILKLLRGEGFNITVVTGMRWAEKVSDVKYIYFPLLDVPSKIRLWMNLLLSTKWLSKLIIQSDIVYIPGFAYPVIPLAKKCGKKVIVHLHNYQPITYCSIIFHGEAQDDDFLREYRKSFLFEILENESIHRGLLSFIATPLNKLSRFWLRQADGVICVSKRQAEIIRRGAPELAGKVRVVYNPLPNVQYTTEKVNEPSFLYLGGSSFCKGIHVLAQASVKLLRRNRCRFVLTNMVNERWGRNFNKFNQAFNNLFLVRGRIPHDELMEMCSKATALLFPSICEEPLPYSIVEAMLVGTIPISSKIGGIPEIVQETYAEKMLFTPSDAADMIDRMERVLSLSKEELVDIGASLREETLRRFRDDEIRRPLLKILKY